MTHRCSGLPPYSCSSCLEASGNAPSYIDDYTLEATEMIVSASLFVDLCRELTEMPREAFMKLFYEDQINVPIDFYVEAEQEHKL